MILAIDHLHWRGTSDRLVIYKRYRHVCGSFKLSQELILPFPSAGSCGLDKNSKKEFGEYDFSSFQE